MNETGQNIVNTNTLANLLAEKLSLKDKDAEELVDIANRYPYFGFTQFLLAKKLSAVDKAIATKQLQQCTLYFSNPFWLHYLLGEDASNNIALSEPALANIIPTKDIYEELKEKIQEENNNHSESSETSVIERSEEAQDFTEQQVEKFEEENINNLDSSTTPFKSSDKIEAVFQQSQQKVEEDNRITSESSETAALKASMKAQGKTEQPQEKSEETNTNAIDKVAAAPSIQTEEKNFESVESVTDAVEEVVKKNRGNIIEGTKEEQPVIETTNEEGEEDAEREKLSKLIEQHLSEFRKPVEGNEEIPLTTRVYHAIDYFASQGIKLDPRLISEDKLGNKVKKFTDWLKQMKRVNENPTDLGTDTQTEQLIEKIAQTSNETKDIITETMAQVLIKQGKIEKAVQLYQKLSFLNPSKTTYFAAKINELKGIK